MSIQGHRRAAWVVTAGGGVLFVVLAAWLVPWQPVPGGSLAPVPATSVFSDAQIQRAEDFSRWARVWSWGSLLLSLAVACWFGFTRHGRALVARMPGPWWLQVLETVAALEIIGRVLTLPFAVLMRRHLLDYGLTNQSWTGFAVDLVKGEVLTIVVVSIGVIALVGCARRWTRAWPAVAGAVLG
ncbi:MAG: heat shock protein HtpX, partial [Nocardioides sp.]|nr:heat shock protein HtpX [Nocardioides sp.]